MLDTNILQQEVRKLAEQYPEAVYLPATEKVTGKPAPTCHYDRGAVANGPKEEGCIMGHVFRKWGIEDELLRQIDGSIDGAVEFLVATGNMEDGPSLNTYEMEWLSEVQQAQDNGSNWATAVDWADQVIQALLDDDEF